MKENEYDNGYIERQTVSSNPPELSSLFFLIAFFLYFACRFRSLASSWGRISMKVRIKKNNDEELNEFFTKTEDEENDNLRILNDIQYE